MNAYVTANYDVYTNLRRDLYDNKDCKVFMVGSAKAGWRFDRIIVLCRLETEQEKEWFEHFRCGLAPGGKVLQS